jgi:hypothetical protein
MVMVSVTNHIKQNRGVTMEQSKRCSNCLRWKEPLTTSACNLEPAFKQHDFIPTGDGYYWCLDFKTKQGNE